MSVGVHIAKCWGCGFILRCDPHHFVPRRFLAKEERDDERFWIPLCTGPGGCHNIYHFHPEESGLNFYLKRDLIKRLTERSGNDRRWLMWLARAEARMEMLNISSGAKDA